MPNNRLDLVGKRVGKLEILSCTEMYSKSRSLIYRCLCDCGEEVLRPANKLKESKFSSCSNCRTAWNKGKPRTEKGRSGLVAYYSSYKKGAQKRNLEFELTLDQFKSITSSKCSYCGVAPSSIHFGSLAYTMDWGGYVSNGIDRVNSSLGYALDNCTPCCMICNKMKQQFSKEEFIAQCRKITEKHKEVLDSLEYCI
jgi:hypothetical protein